MRQPDKYYSCEWTLLSQVNDSVDGPGCCEIPDHREHLRPYVKRSLTTPQEINLTNPERYHSLSVLPIRPFLYAKKKLQRDVRGEKLVQFHPCHLWQKEETKESATKPTVCCCHRRVFGHSGVIRSLNEKLQVSLNNSCVECWAP